MYHWTPARRLPSVLTHGILCRRELDARGIPYDPHSYGRAGKELDFAGHVCVSFHPHKGMMKGDTESGPPAVILMSSELVVTEGTFYCPENTAKSEYTFDALCGWTSVQHLDELFEGPTEWRLRDWQAEVWIPYGIPVEQFLRVWFRNKEERDQAVEACGNIDLPMTLPFGVGPSWGFPSP